MQRQRNILYIKIERERERQKRQRIYMYKEKGEREGREEGRREREGYCTSVKAWRLPSCTQDPLNLKNEQKIMYSTHKD